LLAKLVEFFDYFGLDVDSHVLSPLNEERLIDQIAQGVLLAVFDIGAQLLRCALALALLLGVFLGCGARFIELGAGDDFVVDAGDDFFDGLAGDDLSFFRLGRLFGFGFFSGSGAAMPGFSSAGACGLSGCWDEDS